MSPTLNGHGETPLASLAARLTDPQDRETYAALISYFDSLPRGDELFRLVQLLGLLSLLGQRVPDALAEFMAELRKEAKAMGDYYTQVDGRLACLPHEIADGVDADAIAKAMSESFRQQLADTGLQDTAAQLKLSLKEINALANNMATALTPIIQEYKVVSARISAEVGKLTAASRLLQEQNARLMGQERSKTWVWRGLLALVLVLTGGVWGTVLEKQQTADLLSNIQAQIERLQAPVIPSASKKNPGTNRGAHAGKSGGEERFSPATPP